MLPVIQKKHFFRFIMDSLPNSALSIISSAECPYFFLSTCFLNPFASAIAIVMAFAVYRVRSDLINKQRNVSLINFVLVSLICSVIYYLNSIFMTNSLLIPWDFSALDYQFADIGDFIATFIWSIGKIAFYCALCLHLIHQLNDGMESQVFCIFFCFFFRILCFYFFFRWKRTLISAKSPTQQSTDCGWRCTVCHLQ